MIYKNESRSRLIETFMMRIVLDAAAALHYVVEGKFRHAQSVVKAHSDFAMLQSSFKHKRRENSRKATQQIIPQQYKGSILLDFHLRGKKTFDSILSNASQKADY